MGELRTTVVDVLIFNHAD